MSGCEEGQETTGPWFMQRGMVQGMEPRPYEYSPLRCLIDTFR